jgi:serine protease Do
MNGFGEISERLRRSTVGVRPAEGGSGGGSGVAWRGDGLVITNAHVARTERVLIETWDGRRLGARVAARDPRRDLAAVRLDAGELAPAEHGDSAALRPGELVIAVGNPLGFSGALSTGVVHGVGPLRGLGARRWVQADVRLMPGNSGGPLADAHGRVVGINTMIAGRLALAVPSNTVREFLERGASPMLGVALQPVAVDFDRQRILGLLVVGLEPASAAEAASLIVGDVLLAADGRRFRSPDDLSDAIQTAAGGVLRLEFLRGDRRRAREVAVRFEERRAMAA